MGMRASDIETGLMDHFGYEEQSGRAKNNQLGHPKRRKRHLTPPAELDRRRPERDRNDQVRVKQEAVFRGEPFAPMKQPAHEEGREGNEEQDRREPQPVAERIASFDAEVRRAALYQSDLPPASLRTCASLLSSPRRTGRATTTVSSPGEVERLAG